MKFKILTLFLVLAGTTGYAQDFGKTIITGNINYATNLTQSDGYYGNSTSDNTTASINPGIAFFVNKRLAVGAAFGYRFSDRRDDELYTGQSTPRTNLFSVGPMARYYVLVNDRLAFYLQARASYITGKQGKANVGPSISGGSFSFTPALTFFATRKIGLELLIDAIEYESLKFDSTNNTYDRKRNTLSTGFDLSNVSLGISFYFGRTAAE